MERKDLHLCKKLGLRLSKVQCLHSEEVEQVKAVQVLLRGLAGFEPAITYLPVLYAHKYTS